MNHFLSKKRDLEAKAAQDQRNFCRCQTSPEAGSIAPRDCPRLRQSPRQGHLLSSVLLLAAVGLAGFSGGRVFQQGLDRHKTETARVSETVTPEMLQITYHTLKIFKAPVGEDMKEFKFILPRLLRGFQEIESKRMRQNAEQIRRKVAKALGLPATANSEQMRISIEGSQTTANAMQWAAIRKRVDLALDMESLTHMVRKADAIQDRAMWIAFNERFPPSQAETLRYYEITRPRLAQDFGLDRDSSWRAIQTWIEQREHLQDAPAFNTIRTSLGFDPIPQEKIDSAAWQRLHSILNHETPMQFS